MQNSYADCRRRSCRRATPHSSPSRAIAARPRPPPWAQCRLRTGSRARTTRSRARAHCGAWPRPPPAGSARDFPAWGGDVCGGVREYVFSSKIAMQNDNEVLQNNAQENQLRCPKGPKRTAIEQLIFFCEKLSDAAPNTATSVAPAASAASNPLTFGANTG